MGFEPINEVLNQYTWSGSVVSIELLGANGGFSGAQIWRVHCQNPDCREVADLCVRRWPPGHPTRERLNWIHHVLLHVANNGLPVIAAPLSDRTGATVVEQSGMFWEVSPWVPGTANYRESPQPEKLEQTMHALAKFHLLAAQLPGCQRQALPDSAIERTGQLQATMRDLESIAAAISTIHWTEFQQRARAVLHAIRGRIPVAIADLSHVTCPVRLLPCIRDIWHDHLLFDRDRLVGIVDFGALRIDTVAVDIARVLGSLVGSVHSDWQRAIGYYECVRSLDDVERNYVDALDRAAVILGPVNWIRWVCVERKTFERPELILRRLDDALQRLQ